MSSVSAIWKILTLSCEASARLVSESLDGELPRAERIAVRLHALCCRSCRRYRKQMLLLRNLISRRVAGEARGVATWKAALPPDTRRRLEEAIRRGISENRA